MLSKTKTGSLLAAAAAAASIFALTACGSNGAGGSPGAGSGSTPSSTVPATGQGSASGPSSASGQGAQATANRTPECDAGELRISYTNNQQINDGALAGMSKTDNVVMFVNVGSSTCVIQGYPGIAALNAHGTQIQQARRSGEAVHPVYLRPGAVASALVSADTASCSAPKRVAGLLVTAPDQYTSIRLGSPGEMCLGSLTVHPAVPGNAAGIPL